MKQTNAVKWYLEARCHNDTMEVVTKDLLKHVKISQKLKREGDPNRKSSHRKAMRIIRDKFWELAEVKALDREDFNVKGYCDLSILKLVVSELDILNNIYNTGELSHDN